MPDTPRPAPAVAMQVEGALSVIADGHPLGGRGRMALLREIDAQGSITRAARALGISYKGAWDAVDAMNASADAPLVERVAGGRGGGGTRLTVYGRRLVARYEELERVHQRFVRVLTEEGMDLGQDFSLLQVLNVKTSARNQWVGRVGAIHTGAVNDGVEVLLPGSLRLNAVITRDSTESLALRVGSEVIVMVKASAVLLATGLGDARVSASNRLDGVVVAVRPGAVNAEVILEAACGLPVTAIITQASVDVLGLEPGTSVSALIKASDLILATIR
jgi:molybdate transport system regulatory protein